MKGISEKIKQKLQEINALEHELDIRIAKEQALSIRLAEISLDRDQRANHYWNTEIDVMQYREETHLRLLRNSKMRRWKFIERIKKSWILKRLSWKIIIS
jgi:hypothetical protein